MADNISDNVQLKVEQFLTLIGDVLVHDKQIHLIQDKIRRHFNATSSSYLFSIDFRLMLNHIHNVFTQKKKPKKYYTLLYSFDQELRKHSIYGLGSHRSSIDNIESFKSFSCTHETTAITPCKSSITILPESSSSTTNNEDDISSSLSAIIQTIEQPSESNDNIVLTSNESQLPVRNEELIMTTTSDNVFDNEVKRKKKISKLERRLSSLSKTIRELEEKDLSLDEMGYSDLYLVESNLKKQAYEIYTQLAQLNKQSLSVERILEEPISLTETEIDNPLINKALENMVNQTTFLPSFNDILDTVDKTNEKYELGLSTDTRKGLAEKSFKIIGTKIKERRMADFNDIMNSRLPEDFDIERNDPALDSVEIENTLLENKREALSKTEKILEEFSQIDPDVAPEINIESSDESTVESDEEEKGEEEEEDDDDEPDPELETIAEPLDNKPDENQYDIVDILPPFSPKFSSSSPSNITETINTKDSVEATVEISLVNDRTLRILHTASIPLKRAARNPFVSIAHKAEPQVFTVTDDDDDDDAQESQSISLIPRRRRQQQHTSTNDTDETVYSIYTHRITSTDLTTTQKRLSKDINGSSCKKRKEEPDIVILD